MHGLGVWLQQKSVYQPAAATCFNALAGPTVYRTHIKYCKEYGCSGHSRCMQVDGKPGKSLTPLQAPQCIALMLTTARYTAVLDAEPHTFCRWMAALAEGSSMPGSCVGLMRRAAEAGAKDKQADIREAASQLAAVCASNKAPEVRIRPACQHRSKRKTS